MTGTTPLPMETRGNYYLAPSPAGSNGNNGDGLTEVEDMRLNRLLRSTNSSSPPVFSPPSPDKVISKNGHGVTYKSGKVHRDCKSITGSSSGRSSKSTNEINVLNEELGVMSPLPLERDGAPSGIPFIGGKAVSRELFVSPEQGADAFREKSHVSSRERVGHIGAEVKGSMKNAPRVWAREEEEKADDLEDISDGGFHSGCWRRKYASGEMR